MLIKVNHSTSYLYSQPVELGIHSFYLHPQYRPYYKIENQSMKVFPDPSGSNFREDLLGNWYQQAWFQGKISKLEICSEWEFKLSPFNPFSFIVEGAFEEKFFEGKRRLYLGESNFLRPFFEAELKEAADFLDSVKTKSSGLVDFLTQLTGMIHLEWRHVIRHEQNIWSPEETFSKKEGSCRDLAFMQMAMLRSVGLATRFASGYSFNPDVEDGHELHAWLEVFLPGAGWVGLDPSLGLFTDNGYIPLALHYDPLATSPVQGVFYGTAHSKLEANVSIKIISG